MEVVFSTWITGYIPVLALDFFSQRDGINCRLVAHFKPPVEP
jgi:hypothetical protein